MVTGAWRWKRVLLLAAIAGGMIWGGWKGWELRRHRKAIAEIEAELDEGRPGTATRKLLSLLTRQPDSYDALYLLGASEMMRGRTNAADEAWARVPPESPFAARSILGRMQIRAELGQLAEAERIVRDALNDPRIDGANLTMSLGPIYCQQGRMEETLRLIEARWNALNRAGEGDSQSAIYLLRGHIERRLVPIPVEVIRSDLDPAGRLNPQDDRIWLGKANLAIRDGLYDDAARWLDACLRQRPEDVPVWRARLDWAMATNRVADARQAMEHLPVDESTPTQVRRLAAWLAARRGDHAAERHALEGLVAASPTDSVAFDRLAELATLEGQPNRAEELRRQKAEIARLEARYQKLYQRNQPTRDAEEMARLAEQLGQQFEARAFLTVAIMTDSNRDDLRRDLDRLNSDTIEQPGQTLADVLFADLDVSGGYPPFAVTRPAPQEQSSPPIPLSGDLGRTDRKSNPN